jgi:hypothetical protein
MPLPFQKKAFKPRGPYKAPRNPSGKNLPKIVKLKLSPRKKFFNP